MKIEEIRGADLRLALGFGYKDNDRMRKIRQMRKEFIYSTSIP